MLPKPPQGDSTGPWARSLAFHALLNDGRRVRVRPVVPADRAHLVAGLARMSTRSRYLRFHGLVSQLSEAQLRYFTELDPRVHFAWAAFAVDEAGTPGVGVARFVRDRDDPAGAEFAITVLDEWQGIGLGSLLLRALLDSAAARGVDRLVASVLAENTTALQLFERFGARRTRVDDEVFEVSLRVPRSLWDSQAISALPAPGTR